MGGLARAMLVSITLVVSSAPASGTAGHAPTKMLHFPANQYVGALSVEDPCLGTEYLELGRDLSLPLGLDPKRVALGGDWDFVGSAQGDVVVPADRKLQLRVMLRIRERDASKIATLPAGQYQMVGEDRYRLDPDDLAGLLQLAPDDLHMLSVSTLIPTADAERRVLEPILRLTGLEILSLYRTGIPTKAMERLKALHNLRALELQDERIAVQGLAVLKDLPALEYFDMYPGTTDTGLKFIAQAQSLRWLRVRTGRIWGRGLAELAKLPHLERLALWGTTGLTDRHVSFLEGLAQLKSLTLWGTDAPLTDTALASIGKLTSLEELYFIRINTRFTDAGMRHLEHLSNLRKISFTFCQIGAEGLQHLANLPRLESVQGLAPTADAAPVLPSLGHLKALDVNWVIPPIGTPVPPEVVAAMGQLQSVEDLAVMGGQWSQDDLLVFGKLGNLKRLRLGMHDGDLSDAVLAEVAKLKDLTFLSLSGTTLSKRGLNQLNVLTKLHTLDVTIFPLSAEAPGIDETPLDLSALTNLKTLELTGVDLQDADLASLAHMPHLEWVVLQSGAISEEALIYLRDLAALKQLSVSNLSCTTGSGLAGLTGMQKARSFRLSGRITDTALNRLAVLPSLWSLTIETDEIIRPETVARLRQRLPAVEYIHVREPMRFDRPPVRIRGPREPGQPVSSRSRRRR